MNVSGLTFGNNVTFQCEEGFKINGTEMIKCMSTGNFSASVPTCSEGRCIYLLALPICILSNITRYIFTFELGRNTSDATTGVI
jgi:hypothetical protein